MKKLLYITLFSMAIVANATEKKEIVENTKNEKEVMNDNSKEIKNSAIKKETPENVVFFGCGSQGNSFYNIWRAEGYSHREARALRRAFVRDCRGNGPDGWLGGIF